MNRKRLKDRRMYVRGFQYQSPDITVRLGLDELNSSGTFHTRDDDVAFLLEIKNQWQAGGPVSSKNDCTIMILNS